MKSVTYKIWVPSTKQALLWFESYLTKRQQSTRVAASLSDHSLLHMAYLRAQFSAQRSSACTWMIYPKSSSLVTSNLTLMILRYISRSRQRTLIHFYAKLMSISNMFQSGVGLTTFWSILKKTKFVLFGVRQLISKLPSNITVPFLGQDLVPVTSFKDLGVTLDSNLTFNGHIASLTSSLLSTLVQINRVRLLFSKDVLYIIRNSLQTVLLLDRMVWNF